MAEVEEAVAAEEVPDWLKELGMAKAEEAAAPEAEIPVAELPPLEVAPPVAEALPREEVPEWIRELGAPVAEGPLPPPVAAAEELASAWVELPAVPAMEVPDWLRELAASGAEQGPPLVELPVEVLVPGVGIEAGPEVVLPVEEAAPALEVPIPEVTLASAEESVPGAMIEAAPEVVLPVEEVALPPEAEPVREQIVPAVEEVALPSQLDDLLTQLKARPRDYQLQLELARLYRSQRDWNAAFKYYERLIASGRLVPAVIDDLKPLAGTTADLVRLYRLLGDAYMHEDRLDEALSMYRLARQALTQ